MDGEGDATAHFITEGPEIQLSVTSDLSGICAHNTLPIHKILEQEVFMCRRGSAGFSSNSAASESHQTRTLKSKKHLIGLTSSSGVCVCVCVCVCHCTAFVTGTNTEAVLSGLQGVYKSVSVYTSDFCECETVTKLEILVYEII